MLLTVVIVLALRSIAYIAYLYHVKLAELTWQLFLQLRPTRTVGRALRTIPEHFSRFVILYFIRPRYSVVIFYSGVLRSTTSDFAT
jgi:hypothetical protein